MKKVILFAALAIAAIGMSSCKKGQCACIGTTNGTQIDIMQHLQQTGYTDDMACDEIKAQHPNAAAIACQPGKTLEEVEKDIKLL